MPSLLDFQVPVARFTIVETEVANQGVETGWYVGTEVHINEKQNRGGSRIF